MKPHDRLTVFLVALLIVAMLPPASPEMAESAVSAEIVSTPSSSPAVEEVASSAGGSCTTCQSACSTATAQGGLAPLPPRSDLAGEVLRYGAGLSIATGSGAVTYEGIELAIPGRGPALQVSLNYHSLYRQGDDGWGYGWSFNRDWRYQLEPNGDVTVLLARSVYDFASDGQGGFISATAGMTLTWQSSTLLLNRSDEEFIFFGEPDHKHVTRWEDADGAALAFTYDGDDQLTAISNGQGRQITLTHLDGRLRTIVDAGSAPERRLQLDYSPGGDLVTVTDALGQTRAFSYDAGHRLTGMADPQGNTTAIVYDGDYVDQVVWGEATTRFHVDDANGTITIHLEAGEDARQWVYTFDYMGALAEITYPDGSSTSQNWDDVQNQWSQTDENGHTSVTIMDEDGRLQASRDPLGHATTFAYDATLRTIAATTDPTGHTTTFEYDAARQMTAMIDPLGQRMAIAYNDQGDMVSLTDPLWRTTGLAYDAAGNLTATTNPLGIATTMTYDGAGNLVTTTDGNGHGNHFAYDALGRIVGITDALGRVTTLAYDGNGNLVRQVDPNGHETRFTYDALDRTAVIRDALGGEVRLAYDAWGNLTALTDAAGHTTSYSYNARDRLTAETDPLGRATNYNYDAAGNLVGRTDSKGETVTYTYDAADQLIRIDTPGDDDIYTFYDPAGRVTTYGDADLETGITYDAAGRATQFDSAYDGVAFPLLELAYAYDAAGQVVSKTLPGGQVIEFEYDAAGRLTAIDDGRTRHELAYDPGDRLIQAAPAGGQAGVRANYTYDAADRVTALTNASPDGGITFDTFGYAYDPAGNVLGATHQGETTSYAYDALYRLTEVMYPDGSWARYTYDEVGNRLSLETTEGLIRYAYDAADQLLVMTDTLGVVTTFAYDANGNLASRIAGGQTTGYQWDAFDRLTQRLLPDGSYVAYTYGPDGRRLSRRGRAGDVVYYIYDGLNLVEERDAAGNILASYVHGERPDRPLSMTRGGETYYYLYDRLGSVVGLSDGTGSLVARYEYDAWGNLRSESGSVENPFRFAGREWDGETGLYYNRARYYDPALGRFLSRDPLGQLDGTNHYVYVANNPVNYTDNMGTEKCRDFWGCFNDCLNKYYKSMELLQTLLDSVLNAFDFMDQSKKLKTWKPLYYSLRSPRRTKIFAAGKIREIKREMIFLVLSTAKDWAAQYLPKSGIEGLDAGFDIFISGLDVAEDLLSSAFVRSTWTTLLGRLAALKAAFDAGFFVGQKGYCFYQAIKCKDKEQPQIQLYYQIYKCDQYSVTATDNCELAENPSGPYSAAGGPRTITARDRAGNSAQKTIPACKSDCSRYVKPKCECGHLELQVFIWNQQACAWTCGTPNPSPSKECPACSDPVQDPVSCQWSCESRPRPPAPPCGSDKCGNPLRPVPDKASCGWRCQGDGNNPCNPDDTRSTAGLALPVLTPFSASSWTIANAFAEPSAIPVFEPEQAPQCSIASASGDDPTPGSGIAILDNGFSISLQDFLAQQGVAADRIAPAFSPDMVERYPALFIPSGGLSGYAGSELMRRRLAQYVANGGVLVVFAQEYGDEFALLPGGVGGYGFDEDLNCHANSAQIVSFAPMLLGQSREVLSLNIDGFFTGWPAGTETLLSRLANGMPAMLTYPYGAGHVVATTAYADMAYYQGQGTPEEEVLLRDLARWALAPDLATDTYGPNDQVTVPLTLTNQTTFPVDQLGYVVGDPWARPALSQTQSLPDPLDPGETTHVTLTVDLSTLPLREEDRYGLWSVDVTLSDSGGSITQEAPDAFRFAVTHFVGEEGGHSYLGKPYALTVTSATEEYYLGLPATFTYHVFNHSDQEETFEVRWLMRHHKWAWVPGHRGLASITVPGYGTGSFERTLNWVASLDRVCATLYLHDQEVAYAERGFWAVEPQISQTIITDRDTYDWGDTPVVTITIGSRLSTPITVSAFLQVSDPGNQIVMTDTRTLALAAVPVAFSTTLPPLTQPGYYRIAVQNSASRRKMMAPTEKRLYLPPIRIHAQLETQDRISAGAPITLTVHNRGEGKAPPTTVDVSLTNPSGTPIWSGAHNLPEIAVGQSFSATFSLNSLDALALGDNILAYLIRHDSEALANRRTVIPARLAIEGEFDQPDYRVRDTLFFTATLHNTGRFDLVPLTKITIPIVGLSATRSVTLPAGSDATVPISTTLPASLLPGTYSLHVSAQQGATVERDWTFVVPPSSLEAQLVGGPYRAGEAIEVAVRNYGGVDTTANYSLSLTGLGAEIAQAAGNVAVSAGTVVTLTLPIPSQAASGNDYVLQARVHDQETSATDAWSRSLAVEGVSAVVAAATERPAYLSGEIITATGAVNVTAGMVVDAPLELLARRAAPAGWEVLPNSRVSDDPGTTDQGSPAIAVDTAGNAYAVWMDGRNDYDWSDIYFAYRPAGGTWGANVRVNDDTGTAEQGAPAIAVDTAGNAYAVWSDRRNGPYTLYFAYRPAGGTWGANVPVSDDATPSQGPSAIAVDAEGNAYAVWRDTRNEESGDIYFAYRPAGGTWGANVRVNDDTSMAMQHNPAIAVDTVGNAYAVWTDWRNGYNVYFAYRPAGGTWGANVPVNDNPGTVDPWIPPAFAVDTAGNAYAVWTDYYHFPYNFYFAYRPAGGTWSAHVPVNDDPGYQFHQSYPAIAVDGAGNAYAVWGQLRNDSYFDIHFAYRPAGGTWGANVRVNDDTGMAEQGAPAIAVDTAGNAYAVWGDRRSGDSDVYFGDIHPIPTVIWSRALTVTTTTTWPFVETIGALDGDTGKFYLDARLKNQHGQQLGYHRAPFYVYPPGVALTLETDRAAYRPGDVVQVSGRVTNTAVLPATIPLAVTADADLLLSRTLTLAPGAGEPYAASVTAAGSFTLKATAGTAQASQSVTVAPPAIEATLQAPSLVGRAPFTASVAIANTGLVSASLVANFDGQATRSATLASGERTLLEASLVIAEDTELTVDISGDVTLSLTQLITQGEQVSLTLGLPAEPVWTGPVATTYTLTNAGLLPSSVPLSVELDDAAVLTRTVATLPGQVLTDEVLFDLAPGVHCLTAAIPGQQAGGCVTVQDPDAVRVRIDEALLPARLVGREPLTVTLTNPGPGPVDGVLHAETVFDLAEMPFSLDAGGTQVLTGTLASDNAPAGGTYTVTVGAWVNAALHSQVERFLEVPAPELQVSMPAIVLVPGLDLTVPMTVHNPGGIGVPFTMTLDLHGLYAADRVGWAGPGETIPISYTIALPADVEARRDIGHYTLNGAQTMFTYTIAGYQLDMNAHLSSLMASAGQPVTATIWMTDTSGLALPIPLTVQLAGAGEPQTEAITLTGSAQTTFVITAPVQSALLSYGLYHPEGRSLLLDTLRLYVQGDLIGIQPDRARYLAGETVQLTALATVTGTLTWQAFAISQTLALVPDIPATLAVPLASDLTAGTYRVWYQFTTGDGRWVQDEVPFDVMGDRVEIRQVYLDRSASGSQEVITATMRLRSLTALDGVVLTGRVIAPDESELVSGMTTLDLPQGSSWMTSPPLTFARDQVGSYWFRYELTQNGRDVASGWQAFDVMGPVVLGVNVPRAYFLDTQPVTASVALLNEGALPARLTVTLDGQVAQELTIAEGGEQTILLDLGVLSPGEHTLIARLADSNGQSSQGTATILVRHLGLEVQMPAPDGLVGWHVITPTIWLWPEIVESAAHYRWDGGVSKLATDNQVEIPADGQHELTAWAELPDGTAGPAETATLWLDREPPSVAASIQPGRPVMVSLSATDGASGVDSIDYWDASTWQTYTVPLAFTAVQTTTLFYRAHDRAGNDSGVREVQAPPAEPAYGLTLSADTNSQEGAPGATVAYALIITNTGVAADTFTVQSAGNVWPSHGPLEVGPLDAGRSARFVVAVDIPTEVTPNETDTSTWTVLSQGNPSQSAGQSLTTQARVTYGLAIEAGRTTRSAAPGGAVSYQVRVTNQGNVVDTFDVAVTGNTWPVDVLSVVGPLAPGAYADLDVTVQVPVTAIPGESDTATVSVTSQADATQSANIVLSTEAAISQTNNAPLAPTVIASQEGVGVKLTWQHLAANSHYEVWRSVSPYFDPDDPAAGAIKLDNVYPPAGAGTVVYVDTNPPPEAYYVVRGVNGTGQVSGISNRLGRFSFELVPDQ